MFFFLSKVKKALKYCTQKSFNQSRFCCWQVANLTKFSSLQNFSSGIGFTEFFFRWVRSKHICWANRLFRRINCTKSQKNTNQLSLRDKILLYIVITPIVGTPFPFCRTQATECLREDNKKAERQNKFLKNINLDNYIYIVFSIYL